jgi:hypothetical protein
MNRVAAKALTCALLALGLGLTSFADRTSARAQNPDRFDVAAPELVGPRWLNTPGNKPLTLASRKGKVTVLHFWTFG